MNRRAARDHDDVAFYVPSIGPLLIGTEASPGGAETQIFLLARELACRGVKVGLIVFDLPGIEMPSSVAGMRISVRPGDRTHELFGRLRETIHLGRAVLDAGADVLVARIASPQVGLAALFAKLSRSRFIYSSANISDFDLSRVSPKRRNQQLFRLGIRLADEVVVQTSEQARLCKDRFGRSPVLIGSIAEPTPRRDGHPEAFLWIGRIVSYKQPLAFVELARSLPEAQFRMVAMPSPRSRGGRELMLALQASAAGVSNLELLSPRPRGELTDLIERAVAVVNTADYEGMPNVFLEGWARGVPALALTHDPDGVIERHELGEFAHGSARRMVELARELWERREDRMLVAARCRDYVLEHHSPGAIAVRWQELLRTLAKPSLGRETALKR
jgi:glycosyltransferase involved in cell wall biosynthesis